jgi:hypothetical protein
MKIQYRGTKIQEEEIQAEGYLREQRYRTQEKKDTFGIWRDRKDTYVE